jgi:hypothetical protein
MFHDLNIQNSLLAAASAALGGGVDRFNLPKQLKDIVPDTRTKYLSVTMQEQRKSVLREAYESVMGDDYTQEELFGEFANAVHYVASSGTMPSQKVSPATKTPVRPNKKAMIQEAEEIITQLLEMSQSDRDSIVSELSADEVAKINRLMSRCGKNK